MKQSILLAGLLFLMLRCAYAQTNDTLRYEYGIIHSDVRDNVIETYFGDGDKKEYQTDKKTYFVTFTELLNTLGKEGWEIKSTGAYASYTWGSTPSDAYVVFLSRRKK